MWAFILHCAAAQSTATFKRINQNNRSYYALTNAKLGVANNPQPQLWLNLSQGAVSTRELSDVSTTLLTFPNAQFNAVFAAGTDNSIAIVQLAENGIMVCKNELFFDKHSAACKTQQMIRATCTDACRYAAIKNNDAILAVANMHVYSPDGCAPDLKLITTTGKHVRVCSHGTEFNPADMGAAVVFHGASAQSIYLPDTVDDGPISAAFVIVVIVTMVIWTGNAKLYMEDRKLASNPASRELEVQTITVAISDLALTVTSASIFTSMNNPEAYIPTETVFATTANKFWIAVYVAVLMVGVALSIASSLLRHLPDAGGGAHIMAYITRPALETSLMAVVHFHMPDTMGDTFKRSIGFFLGVVTCAIIARDVPVAISTGNTSIVQRAIVAVWAIVAILNAAASMLLPVLYQSAGIMNAAAPAATAAFVVVIAVITQSAASLLELGGFIIVRASANNINGSYSKATLYKNKCPVYKKSEEKDVYCWRRSDGKWCVSNDAEMEGKGNGIVHAQTVETEAAAPQMAAEWVATENGTWVLQSELKIIGT